MQDIEHKYSIHMSANNYADWYVIMIADWYCEVMLSLAENAVTLGQCFYVPMEPHVFGPYHD